jgi:hypothetical protein
LLATAGVMLLAVACAREKDRLDAEVRRLCARDGGVRVYETMVLSEDEYRKLLNRYGELEIQDKEFAKASGAFYQESVKTYLRIGNPELWRSEYRIVRRSDGKVLATSVFYTRRGGDFPGPWHESSFSCPNTQAVPSIAHLAIKKTN